MQELSNFKFLISLTGRERLFPARSVHQAQAQPQGYRGFPAHREEERRILRLQEQRAVPEWDSQPYRPGQTHRVAASRVPERLLQVQQAARGLPGRRRAVLNHRRRQHIVYRPPCR